jgi:3',5'-cyclic-AMP phosphodiesterase
MRYTCMMPASPFEVFAVEETAVQVMWASLPNGPHRLQAGPASVTVAGGPHPGAVLIEGLEPATSYPVTWRAEGQASQPVATITTLEPPPGRRLCRFATINDIHLGERGNGAPIRIREPHPLPPGVDAYPVRCARDALDEALSWGAEAIVVKGDLTRRSAPIEFAEVAALLADLPVPVEAVLGNHDVEDPHVDAIGELAAGGLKMGRRPWARDLPGLRLVFGQSSVSGRKSGRVRQAQCDEIVELAGSSAGPAFVVLHHQLQRWRLPVYYPPGIPGPDGRRLTAALTAANPNTVIVAGHTHRNRSHREGPLTLIEVGSTKDFPGVWAGYTVYEGGIVQVIRRTSTPSTIAWTEQTRGTMLGIWQYWAPGPLSQRCFAVRWAS